jgi:hypothetical protein
MNVRICVGGKRENLRLLIIIQNGFLASLDSEKCLFEQEATTTTILGQADGMRRIFTDRQTGPAKQAKHHVSFQTSGDRRCKIIHTTRLAKTRMDCTSILRSVYKWPRVRALLG